MQIRKQILFSLVNHLLSESKAEDLVDKHPQLKQAYDQSVRKEAHLLWLLKMEKYEPIADMIGLISAFEQNKQRLTIKDLNEYRNPNDLRLALEVAGESKGSQIRHLKREETDIVYENDQWIVVMPHTVESSIQWGKGTTWCTAATQSKNFFYRYVASKNINTILFYIIKKGANSKVDENSKLSIGFIDNKPHFDGRHGGVSVNEKNDGLTRELLKEILGLDFDTIMNAMILHSNKISGEHPAKKIMQKIAQSSDFSILEKYTKGMNEKQRSDFIGALFEHDLRPEMFLKFARDESTEIRLDLALNISVPAEALYVLSRDKEEWVRAHVALNTSTPGYVLYILSRDKNENVRGNVAVNSKTPSDILYLLARDDSRHVRLCLIGNDNIPEKLLSLLEKDKDESIRKAVKNRKYQNYQNQLAERWARLTGTYRR